MLCLVVTDFAPSAALAEVCALLSAILVPLFFYSTFSFYVLLYLQCFDTVGWATGRVSGL